MTWSLSLSESGHPILRIFLRERSHRPPFVSPFYFSPGSVLPLPDLRFLRRSITSSAKSFQIRARIRAALFFRYVFLLSHSDVRKQTPVGFEPPRWHGAFSLCTRNAGRAGNTIRFWGAADKRTFQGGARKPLSYPQQRISGAGGIPNSTPFLPFPPGPPPSTATQTRTGPSLYVRLLV